MFGPYRLDKLAESPLFLWSLIDTQPMAWGFMGGTLKTKAFEYEKASPASYLKRDDIPPVFIICGKKDAIYPESKWFDKKLNEKKIEHKSLFVTGADHEFNYLQDDEGHLVFRKILAFLKKHLNSQATNPLDYD